MTSGFFSSCPLRAADPVLGLSAACVADEDALKINMTIGAYRDDSGRPQVLDCVRDAEELIFNSRMDHEYLSQDGHAEFNRTTQILMFGADSPVLAERRVFTMQGISGTGCLRLAADFIAAFLPPETICYIPVRVG